MPKSFVGYAAPMAWGPWVTIESHGGSISFDINYRAVGDTLVLGKVRYFNKDNKKVEEQFRDEVIITTGNSWANVEVCFKGNPLGSTVEGTIS